MRTIYAFFLFASAIFPPASAVAERPIERSRCVVNVLTITNLLRRHAIIALEGVGFTDVRVRPATKLDRNAMREVAETELLGVSAVAPKAGPEPLELVGVNGRLAAPCTQRGSITFDVSSTRDGEKRRVFTIVNGVEFAGQLR